MATAILSLQGDGFSREDGELLAAQLLRELGDTDEQERCFLFSPQDDSLRRAEQRNIVEQYLHAIERTGSAELRLGFAAVLTDFLAVSLGGAVPGEGFYEGLLPMASGAA